MTTRRVACAPRGVGLLLAATVAWSCPDLSAAKSLYRCDVAGSLSYADRPCSDGAAHELATPRRPSADQIAHAQAVAERERVLATQLVEQRRQRNQQARPSLAGGIRHPAGGLTADSKPDLTRQAARQTSKTHRDPRVTFEVKAPKNPKKGSDKVSKQR
jgi:hypothetical protein